MRHHNERDEVLPSLSPAPSHAHERLYLATREHSHRELGTPSRLTRATRARASGSEVASVWLHANKYTNTYMAVSRLLQNLRWVTKASMRVGTSFFSPCWTTFMF